MNPAQPSKQKINKKQQILRNADNFINELKQTMQPLSLNFLGGYSNNIQIPQNHQNIFPHNINYRLLAQPPIVQEIDVNFLKRTRQPKLTRSQYQKTRQLRANNSKAFEAKLKQLQQEQKLNLEQRKLALSENNFLTGKFMKNIQISDYVHFHVQKFTDWFPLKARVIKQIDQLKKLLDEEQGTINKIFYFLKSQAAIQATEIQGRIYQIINLSFFLTQAWLYGEAYPYRLICIHRNPDIQQGHFYVYNNRQNEPLNAQSAVSLRNRLILAYFALKNQNNALQINNSYLTNTRNNLSKQLIFNHLKHQYIQKPIPPPVQQISLKNHDKIYTDYPRQSIANMVNSWRQKSYFYHKNSKDFIYIQPLQIHFPKSYLAKNVRLIINNSVNEQFFFIGQNQRSFIFQSRVKKVYAYNLEQFRNLDVEFNVKSVNQFGKTNDLRSRMDVSKIQNQVLGISYELGLIPDDPLLLTQVYKGDFPFVLRFQAAMRRASYIQIPQDLRIFRQVSLLTNIGKIPNIYSSYFYYNYTPQAHPLVSQILGGQQTPVNQKNFQLTYIDFVNFMQREENKSQNFCQYLKIKKTRLGQGSGFVMRDRYSNYCRLMGQNYTTVSRNFQNYFNTPIRISKILSKKQLKSLQDDIRNSQSTNLTNIQQVLQKYIIYQYITKKQAKARAVLSTNSSMIKIASCIIQIYIRSEKDNKKIIQPNTNQISIFFIAFIQTLYPYYFNQKILRQQLLQLRVLTQRYIPQFNYLINRKGIGLQNYASKHLLQLFTSLPLQLCYRFWDFMISDTSRLQQVKLYCMYTLMLYQQKSNLLPIFPINQIVESVQINSNKVRLDNSAFYSITKIVENHHLQTIQRQSRVAQLSKYKYLRKFLFGANNRVQTLDEDDYQRQTTLKQVSMNSQEKVYNKLNSVKGISYPLPIAGYAGYPISKVYVFIGGVFLLNSLNLHTKQYKMQINLQKGNSVIELPIREKSCFVNKFIEFQYNDPASIKNQTKPAVQFRLIQKPNREILTARMKLCGFQKDIIYRENIILNKSQKIKDYQLNNLGTSCMSVSVAIRSYQNQHQLQINNEQQIKQIQFLQKVLDFDLQTSNNQIVKNMSKLDKRFKKIMNPLDQLDVDKYLKLKPSTSFESRTPQWIKISRVSIQQLKAIFAFVFSQQSSQAIRLNFSKYYECYAGNSHKFQLGKFLLDLILMSQIPKTNKINMIYCLTVHYQNTVIGTISQQLSIQTVNSIIKQILNSTGFLNACPFTNKYSGEIVYGCYYQKGTKAEQNKKQITQILQDWAYICQLKSQYRGIILGSAEDLSVLRSMIPANILRQIQREQLCRFQIQYKIGQQIYIWSSTVNSSDFSIVKRGVKFLNGYPRYVQNVQYMTSIAETMYNCQNLIPLQNHSSIDLDQFIQIFSENPLLQYLLTYNEYLSAHLDSRDKNNYVTYEMRKSSILKKVQNAERKNILQNSLNQKDKFYSDFAVFRNQNCIASWRKCKVINDEGKTLVVVNYQDKKGDYNVPRFQTICLDEVQITNKANNQSQFSESQISDQNMVRR